MTTQLQLFNDEPEQQAAPMRKCKSMSLAARARKIIREEGLYNYAMMVKATAQYDEEYAQAHFAVSRARLLATLTHVFDVAVGHQESLEDFIQNVKNIPCYGLQKIE